MHCRHLKAKDTFKERYNIDNPMQSQDIRDKARATNIQRYGCENPILNKEINSKRIKTLIERYGEDNPMKVDEFAKKIVNEKGLEILNKYAKLNFKNTDKIKSN